MKVLILGGTGMLGHRLYQVFAPIFETCISARMSSSQCEQYGFFDPQKIIGGADLSNPEALEDVIKTVSPEVVVNCIGVLKQTLGLESTIEAITLNALLPHWIERLADRYGFRLIQISTDCVFSGHGGFYNETDDPDANDLYGRSKLLGEIDTNNKNCLTLRTSMIGRELQRTVGLLEWFLSQKKKTIKGYKRAIFSGFTTGVLAEILADIVKNHEKLSGLYHISSPAISKYDLLCLINETLSLGVQIEPDETFACDRSLDSSRLCNILNYHPPTWHRMITDIAGEIGQYEQWRAPQPGTNRVTE